MLLEPKAVDFVVNLFIEKSSGLDEICQEAGVSKMTFYRLFVNKADVAEKVLSGELEAGLS
ncbi:MAG: TetR/AcrR family transcriptional regulator, partial [Imperialibacter sp.]|uniref:TetR/AcrR family transcriptional regulator n=1 Tax=Imperialibacter sp. TaxID=2038411 RepID=UPI0032EAAC22